MNKAILVIDMPDSCSKCPLFGGFYSDMCCKGLNNRGIDYPYPENFRQKWCPLKELPTKVDVFIDDWADGYNACLEEVLGQ